MWLLANLQIPGWEMWKALLSSFKKTTLLAFSWCSFYLEELVQYKTSIIALLSLATQASYLFFVRVLSPPLPALKTIKVWCVVPSASSDVWWTAGLNRLQVSGGGKKSTAGVGSQCTHSWCDVLFPGTLCSPPDLHAGKMQRCSFH